MNVHVNISAIKRQAACSGTNRRFQIQKRSQYFIRMHNETLSVIPMCIGDPDCSPFVVESELANLQCFPANFPPLWRQK
jgi:hypothetical protein